jgi:hypothetical protein
VLQGPLLPHPLLLPEAPLLRKGLRLLRSGVLRRSELLRLLRKALLRQVLQGPLLQGPLLPSDLLRLRLGWLLRVLPARGLRPGLLQMSS